MIAKDQETSSLPPVLDIGKIDNNDQELNSPLAPVPDISETDIETYLQTHDFPYDPVTAHVEEINAIHGTISCEEPAARSGLDHNRSQDTTAKPLGSILTSIFKNQKHRYIKNHKKSVASMTTPLKKELQSCKLASMFKNQRQSMINNQKHRLRVAIELVTPAVGGLADASYFIPKKSLRSSLAQTLYRNLPKWVLRFCCCIGVCARAKRALGCTDRQAAWPVVPGEG